MDKAFTADDATICPICNSKLLLLSAHYEAATLSPAGFRTGVIDTKNTFTVVCKNCGFHADMKVTSNGLKPMGYIDRTDDFKLLKDNPIKED